MVDDWHDDSLMVVESPRLVTFIANYEHIAYFVENADGASERSLHYNKRCP